MTEIQKAMHWLLNAEIGLSSKCLMATMLNGGPVEGNAWARFHPHDPSDFKRCVILLDTVPEFRERLELMKSVSAEWSAIVEHWSELESLFNEEKQQRMAPKLYARIKEILDAVRKSKEKAPFNIGDLVEPKDWKHTLASGACLYPYAYVVNTNPFQLMSEEGDMYWIVTVEADGYKLLKSGTQLPDAVLLRMKREGLIND